MELTQPLAESAYHTEEMTKYFLSDFSIFRESHYVFRLRKDRESYFPREEYKCFMKKIVFSEMPPSRRLLFLTIPGIKKIQLSP